MRLLRQFIQGVALRISFMAAGLGISVLLARSLGADSFGHYVFALSVATIIAIPVQAGLPMLLTKHLPKYQVTKDDGRIKGLLAFTFLFIASFSGLVLIVYWGFDSWLTGYFGRYAGREVVHIAMLLVPFIALATSLGAAIRSLGRLFLGQVIETGMRQVLLLAMLSAAALGAAGAQFNAEDAMWLNVAAALTTTLVAAPIVWLACGVTRGLADSRIEWRAWTVTLLPLSLISGLQIILSKSDVIMLRGMVGGEEVALYFIANQLGNLVFLSNIVMRLVTGPMLARAIQKNDVETVQYVYARGALFVFLSTIPLAIVLIGFGPSIVDAVFGLEYRDAFPAVVAFAVGYMAQALFGNTELLLKITDNEWVVLRAMGGAIFANLSLNALLIPMLGALGAAIASMAVTVAVKFYLARQIQSRVGISAFAFARTRAALGKPS